jgi:hypothetical protein
LPLELLPKTPCLLRALGDGAPGPATQHGSAFTDSGHAIASHFGKTAVLAGCWWFALIIPGIWEAEIRRIEVQSQPGQIVGHPSPK